MEKALVDSWVFDGVYKVEFLSKEGFYLGEVSIDDLIDFYLDHKGKELKP
jgi:hypothetical protein